MSAPDSADPYPREEPLEHRSNDNPALERLTEGLEHLRGDVGSLRDETRAGFDGLGRDARDTTAAVDAARKGVEAALSVVGNRASQAGNSADAARAAAEAALAAATGAHNAATEARDAAAGLARAFAPSGGGTPPSLYKRLAMPDHRDSRGNRTGAHAVPSPSSGANNFMLMTYGDPSGGYADFSDQDVTRPYTEAAFAPITTPPKQTFRVYHEGAKLWQDGNLDFFRRRLGGAALLLGGLLLAPGDVGTWVSQRGRNIEDNARSTTGLHPVRKYLGILAGRAVRRIGDIYSSNVDQQFRRIPVIGNTYLTQPPRVRQNGVRRTSPNTFSSAIRPRRGSRP